jgi:hypothetical protein
MSVFIEDEAGCQSDFGECLPVSLQDILAAVMVEPDTLRRRERLYALVEDLEEFNQEVQEEIETLEEELSRILPQTVQQKKRSKRSVAKKEPVKKCVDPDLKAQD